MAYSSGIKKMNWLYKPSAYESAQAWREKRAAMSADFQNQSATTANSFVVATVNQAIGMGDLVAKAAVARIQAEAKGTVNTASTAKYNFSV